LIRSPLLVIYLTASVAWIEPIIPQVDPIIEKFVFFMFLG